MLAAVVAAQAVGGSSSGDASQAALASAMGLMQQRQIDYTRSNESEADRIGIRTLSRTGYDVDAMAGFFQRMALAMRGNQGGYTAPDYLQTHPVTTTRVSEAKQRAEQMKKDTLTLTTRTPGGERKERVDLAHPTLPDTRVASDNPLLPVSLLLPISQAPSGASGQFDWVRERLRALSANTPDAAIREYESIRRSSDDGLTDAQRYGLALARLQRGANQDAAGELAQLLDAYPDNLWLELALGEAESRAGNATAANRRFERLMQGLPNHRAVALTYARVLNEQGGRESGQRAQALLRPLLGKSADDPVFQQTFARASELAGDTARAGEAYAEAAFLNGRAEQALIQLQNLKKREDLDYYARARVDARIAGITPTVLELRRQGIRDPDAQRK